MASVNNTFIANLNLANKVIDLEAENALLVERTSDRAKSLELQIYQLQADTANPVAVAISMLSEHSALVAANETLTIELATSAEQLAFAEQDKMVMDEQIQNLLEASQQACTQRDGYQQQCEGLVDAHNSKMDKARRELERLETMLKMSRKEVSDLRAMNPEKQAKQVKRLKVSVDEQKGVVSGLRVRLAGYEQAKKELQAALTYAAELSDENSRLRGRVGSLKTSLEELCDDINRGNSIKPLATVSDDWEIHSDAEDPECLYVTDRLTKVTRAVMSGQDIPKIRPIPPAVKKACVGLFVAIEQAQDYVSGPDGLLSGSE